MPALRAGFAETDITPPTHLTLAGMFQPRPIQGVHDPLYTRAAVLDDGREKLVLIACDLISFRGELPGRVRAEIAARCGTTPDRVALFGSHTHNGPYTTDSIGRADPDYLAGLEQSLIAVADAARDDLAPVRLTVGTAYEGRLSFNRRYVMKDGRVRTHPPRGSNLVAYAEGPKDPEVGVLGFLADDGSPRGMLVNFTCHPTVMGGVPQVSADYPGALARHLKERVGPALVPLFANGAEGNICQIDVDRPEAPASGPEHTDTMGAILAGQALTCVAPETALDEVALAARSTTIQVPLRDPDTTPYHGTLFSGEPRPDVEERYRQTQAILRERLKTDPLESVEVQVMRVGPAALVMVPCELFVEYGLDIKLRSPIKPTFIVGLSNRNVGYLPTRHAFDRGGYEVRTGMASQLVPEAGDRLVETAMGLLSELA